jgi:serine protease Do
MVTDPQRMSNWPSAGAGLQGAGLQGAGFESAGSKGRGSKGRGWTRGLSMGLLLLSGLVLAPPNRVAGQDKSVEKAVDEKPVDEKPVDEKPVDEKPVDEKPVDEKPVDEKPAEQKAADEKAAEQKASEKVAKIFAGGVPATLADLLEMEARQTQAVKKAMQVTVGIQDRTAQGSGVIISEDGYVLTAAHVVQQAKRQGRSVTLRMQDGSHVLAEPLGLYRTLDAGLAKITQTDANGQPLKWPFAEMADPETIRPGQWVMVMGHPGGYQRDRKPVVRIGRITSVNSEVIVTDCTLIGGDSGGPILDMDGRVIGVNSRIGKRLETNMHVPVSTYLSHWDRLTTGEMWGQPPNGRPYIGVRGEIDGDKATVVELVAGEAGEKAGLKVGDIILAFDRKGIASFTDLQRLVGETAPGETVPIRIRRDDEDLVLGLQIGRKRD